jgi:hypothetical protein
MASPGEKRPPCLVVYGNVPKEGFMPRLAKMGHSPMIFLKKLKLLTEGCYAVAGGGHGSFG